MGAETVIAVAATVIALGSLWVSHTQTRATREHNRQSIRPMLQIRRIRHADTVGLKLVNAGLGPAVVTSSTTLLDGEAVGQWDRAVKHRLFSRSLRPTTYSLRPGSVVLAGQETFLVRFDSDDREQLEGFWRLIDGRLAIEIRYESLYGGEDFSVSSTVDR